MSIELELKEEEAKAKAKELANSVRAAANQAEVEAILAKTLITANSYPQIFQILRNSLREMVLSVLNEGYTGRKGDGTEIGALKDTQVDPDWILFSHHLLTLAEMLDKDYFQPRKYSSRRMGR